MSAPPRRVTVAALALAALLVTTGVWHFVSPDGFRSIVPSFVGSPIFWVAASGVAELLCAGALTLPATRRVGGWATAILFVVVFPANITMAVQSLQGHGSVLVAWLRLPLQIPLVLLALYVAQGGQRRWLVSLKRRTDESPLSR